MENRKMVRQMIPCRIIVSDMLPHLIWYSEYRPGVGVDMEISDFAIIVCRHIADDNCVAHSNISRSCPIHVHTRWYSSFHLFFFQFTYNWFCDLRHLITNYFFIWPIAYGLLGLGSWSTVRVQLYSVFIIFKSLYAQTMISFGYELRYSKCFIFCLMNNYNDLGSSPYIGWYLFQ